MKQAVILIAGGGTRLGARTVARPKCMLEVQGKSLLARMLTYLNRAGIQETILVVGYQADLVRRHIGQQWDSMSVQYIYNDKWETTNNVVSLAMATDSLNQDFILLEGDLIFKWEAFAKMLGPNRIAVDCFLPNMDGTVVSIDEMGSADRFYLKSTSGRPSDLSSYYKTVNIYSFDYENYMSSVVPRLQRLIESGQDQVFYEQAIAEAVDDQDLQLECVLFSGTPWYEIDTEEGFDQAKGLFSS